MMNKAIDLDETPTSESRIFNNEIPIDEKPKCGRYPWGKDDNVDHPKHYQMHNGLEVIDIIDAGVYGLDGIEAVLLGNIIKYIFRFQEKNGLEDLKKAEWYLKKLIKELEKKQ